MYGSITKTKSIQKPCSVIVIANEFLEIPNSHEKTTTKFQNTNPKPKVGQSQKLIEIPIPNPEYTNSKFQIQNS